MRIHQQDRGVRLELINAPADAFVDGEMIASTREMLFSALRDIVTQSGLDSQHVDLDSSQGLTDYVFQLLRTTPVRCAPASSRRSSSAGAATRSAAGNTSTPRGSATNSACAAWMSAPAADRG